MSALRAAGWANVAIGLLHLAGLPWERRLSYWVGIGPDMDRLATEDRGPKELIFSGIALALAMLYAAGLRSLWSHPGTS